MRVYLDSSAIVCLYVAESNSQPIIAFVQTLRRPILLNPLQDLEVRNAIRQKTVRKEITEGMAVRCLRALDDDIVCGRVIRKRVAWEAAFQRAEELSQRLAIQRQARAADLLHVAVALISNVQRFASLDSVQVELAKTAGLEVATF